jgi:hypothetical protein
VPSGVCRHASGSQRNFIVQRYINKPAGSRWTPVAASVVAGSHAGRLVAIWQGHHLAPLYAGSVADVLWLFGLGIVFLEGSVVTVTVAAVAGPSGSHYW